MINTKAPEGGRGRHVRRAAVVAAMALAGAIAAMVPGCAANKPFDPSSVVNQLPLARLFVGPVDPGGELNATSYYNRTFRWSGTDPDGWVRRFYVSIRTQANVPAPWDTTTRTDTTMTFWPDNAGHAEATVLLVCEDDRGALSDTVRQYIPMRNFPPSVNFESDFNPLHNLQREFRDINGQVTLEPSAAADTVYYNWGPMNFRLFAMDLDGAASMDDHYRYTLADGEPEQTWDIGDPAADASLGWIRVPFNSSEEIKPISIFIRNAAPGTRTLRVAVRDEALSETLFRYSWEVRAPRGPVLFIADGASPAARAYFAQALDSTLGVGGWDFYDFWFQTPDIPSVLLETFRKFPVIFWADGGAGSASLKMASDKGGVLQGYLYPGPNDGAQAGRLLFTSRAVVGVGLGLQAVFLASNVGVANAPLPATPLRYPVAKAALHQSGALPDIVTEKAVTSGGQGLARLDGFDNEILYRMEYCTCYGDPRRPQGPYDPVVGIRVPTRAHDAQARIIALSLALENFNATQVTNMVGAILSTEMGVVLP